MFLLQMFFYFYFQGIRLKRILKYETTTAMHKRELLDHGRELKNILRSIRRIKIILKGIVLHTEVQVYKKNNHEHITMQ